MAAAPGGASARRSLLLSFAHRYSVMLLRLLMLMVLARLLTPLEYGVIAVAIAVIGIGATLADMGLMQYLIRAEDQSPELRGGALGLGLAIGALITAGTVGACAIAPAAWFGDELRETLLVLSLTFLIQPFATVAGASLRREMRFGTLYWVGIAEEAALVGVAVGLALLGMGPVGLAWAHVAQVTTGAIALALVVPPVRPVLRRWGAIFRFGRVWTAIGALGEIGDALSRLAIGSLLGLGAAGLLSRAETVLQMFDRALTDAIQPVVLPALAKKRRADADLAPVYLRQVAYLSVLAWPFFGAVAFLLAAPLVTVLLGSGWAEAIPAARIVALAGVFLPVGALVGPYFVALDATGRWLPLQLALQSGKVVLVAAGACVSLELACAALVAAAAGKAALAGWLLHRCMDYRARDLLRVLGWSLVPTAACLAGAAGGLVLVDDAGAPPLVLLIAAAAAGAIPWLMAVLLVRHPLADEARRAAQEVTRRLRRRMPAAFRAG